MSLRLASIQTAKDDDELFERLSSALKEMFPPELQEKRDQFLAALSPAPRGLRAMAGIFDLDVSMTLDDLAWHFGNHNDERFLEETVLSLLELEAAEAADLFQSRGTLRNPTSLRSGSRIGRMKILMIILIGPSSRRSIRSMRECGKYASGAASWAFCSIG